MDFILKRTCNFLFMLFLFWGSGMEMHAQSASGVRWDRTYGGSSDEVSFWGNIKMEVDPAGEYWVISPSKSGISGEKTDTTRGTFDFWLLKLDQGANIIWDKTYGGNRDDLPNDLLLLPSGDLVISGRSQSLVSGEKTVPNYSFIGASYDNWTIRVENTGNLVWDQVFGSSSERDDLFSIIQLPSGDLRMAGVTRANTVPDGDVTLPTRGNSDGWMIDIDPGTSAKTNEFRLGGGLADQLFDIAPDGTGGYFIAFEGEGPAASDLPGPDRGGKDIVIYRLDATGAISWAKRMGSPGDDNFPHLTTTPSGGCIVVSYTTGDPGGDRSSAVYGEYDIWAFELDNTGAVQWENVYGGSRFDEPYEIIPTCDGNYLIGGYSCSGANGSKTSPSRGGCDMWFVKIDPSGNQRWDYSAGGNQDDGISDIAQFPDGTYGAAGFSDSDISGDKSENSRGGYDVWLVNLAVQADFLVTSACVGQEVQFTDRSTSFTQSWEWDFGDPASGASNQSTATNPTHIYTAPGNYTVRLIAGEGCHADTLSQMITIYPVPVATTGGDQILCPGVTATLGAAPQSGVNYSWTPATHLSQSQVANPGFTGGYGVHNYSLIATNGFCADTQDVQIVRMGIDAGQNGEICTDESWPLGTLAALPGVTYSWAPASAVQNVSAPMTTFHPSGAGNVTLTLTASGGNCVLTDQVSVYTSPQIVADFTVFPEIPLPGQATDLTYNGSGANTFVWSNGNTSFQTQFVWDEAGVYSVSLTVSDSGRCKEKVTRVIEVEEDVLLYIPNAFTPNGDGLNDEFSFTIDRYADFQMEIYDRWGNQIFRTDTPGIFWDGKSYPEGTYLWTITGTSLTGNTFSQRGSIHLIR